MIENLRDRIGKRLQEIRGPRDQRSFAEAIGSVQQTISKYERGEIPRSWLFLARLAKEEDVDLNRLLLGTPRGESLERRYEERGDVGGDGNGREERRRKPEPRGSEAR